MEFSIKKVTERDGRERFVLVNAQTREVLTVHDVSEKTLRRFFGKKGADDALLDRCFKRARARYKDSNQTAGAVNLASDTTDDDDLMLALGLDN